MTKKNDQYFKEDSKGEVILPPYINQQYFEENREKLLKMKHFDFDFTKRYNQNQIDNIVSLNGFQLFLTCHLLSNTFNRAFMKSLQFQVRQWINHPKYHYPLSGKQEKSLEKSDLYQKFKGRNHNFRMLYDV
ncbi:hypothetical protein PBI_SCTP2_81 [Salicola phage SCTP-2]|nr:hypothetical protein PBI_SCTP2_81 [Salicola phage SCTP-2]